MEPKRVLIAGAGGWGRTWSRTLAASTDVEIVGWVDIRREAASEAAALRGLRDIHTGDHLETGIAAARPDFVLNATSPWAHRDVAVTAMEAGLPVLCEKPMADSMQHAREMVHASEETGMLLVISQQR